MAKTSSSDLEKYTIVNTDFSVQTLSNEKVCNLSFKLWDFKFHLNIQKLKMCHEVLDT